MNYMEDGFSFETEMGDDSKPVSGILDSLMRVGRRVLTSELIFMSHFSNSGSGKKRVALAALGTEVAITSQRKLDADFFAGEGLFWPH